MIKHKYKLNDKKKRETSPRVTNQISNDNVRNMDSSGAGAVGSQPCTLRALMHKSPTNLQRDILQRCLR
jgi:hypothetical protein